MKINNLFWAILLIVGACRTAPAPEVSMQEDVHILASDSLAGRETGTEGARLAANYLENRMKQLGLKPAAASGSYTQQFSFKPKKDPHSEVQFDQASDSSITGINVMGLIDNGGARTVVRRVYTRS